jgi:Transposase DDE domain
MNAKPTKKAARHRRARSLLDSLRQFLTPYVYQQACQARRQGRTPRSSRWHAEPLLFVLVLFTWCCGDSCAERFEAARAFYVICHPRRRRPGRSVGGFQKALARLPARVLRRAAAGVRRRLLKLFAGRLEVDGWIPFGVDGSRLECPRAAELERRVGRAGKQDAAPMLWVTAVVHLRSGLLWAWRLGKARASEREHARQLLATLPAGALLVADAGFNGYGWACAVVGHGVSFLIRLSAKVTVLAEPLPSPQAREALVWYWPEKDREAGRPPLRARLLRLRGKKQRQDVWLLTDVLDRHRLPLAVASQFYRWRWENEGLFRTYKRTLKKVKLLSRTVRLVHREAEGALLALQLLLAQGTWALAPRAKAVGDKTLDRCSPRQVLLQIRAEIKECHGHRRRPAFTKRLRAAGRERRQRTSAKEKRRWPRPNDNHQPPRPPKIRELNRTEKRALVHLPLRRGTVYNPRTKEAKSGSLVARMFRWRSTHGNGLSR